MLKATILEESSLNLMKTRAEELLETRGVTIDHPELCAALAEKGCLVSDQQVRFPRADRAGGRRRARAVYPVCPGRRA